MLISISKVLKLDGTFLVGGHISGGGGEVFDCKVLTPYLRRNAPRI